jgi:hypothetical protein
MDNKEKYTKDFLKTYNQAKPDEYGRAEMATLERSTLREIYEKIFVEECQRIFGSGEVQKDKEGLLRQIVKERVVDKIVADGWPQPNPERVGPRDIADSGVEHACVVAEYLIDSRGAEASPSTFFSYTTKNQFDRYVLKVLTRSGKFSKESNIRSEWFGLWDRQNGYSNPRVKYPEGVDDTKIYGVAKPHRYWPAQLMRYLEAVRLGKISESERERLKVGGSLPDLYTIPWADLDKSIEDSKTVDEIAVNIFVYVAERLKTNGLNDGQVVEMLTAGYSPNGPTSEHGDIPQVHSIWNKIITKLKEDINLIPLIEPIKTKLGNTIKFL